MIVTLIIICFLTFWIGFLLGKTDKKSIIKPRIKTEFTPADEEFLNFLNYDGSEQI